MWLWRVTPILPSSSILPLTEKTGNEHRVGSMVKARQHLQEPRSERNAPKKLMSCYGHRGNPKGKCSWNGNLSKIHAVHGTNPRSSSYFFPITTMRICGAWDEVSMVSSSHQVKPRRWRGNRVMGGRIIKKKGRPWCSIRWISTNICAFVPHRPQEPLTYKDQEPGEDARRKTRVSESDGSSSIRYRGISDSWDGQLDEEFHFRRQLWKKKGTMTIMVAVYWCYTMHISIYASRQSRTCCSSKKCRPATRKTMGHDPDGTGVHYCYINQRSWTWNSNVQQVGKAKRGKREDVR